MRSARSIVGTARRTCLHRLAEHYFLSFPKSGRTWTKSVLANYYSSALGIPLFYDFAPIVRPRARAAVPRIVFTHARHNGTADDDRAVIESLASKRVVLLIRRPVDIAQTYYYRLAKRQGRDDVARQDLGSFAVSEDGLPRIVDFLNRWYHARDSFAGFHLLCYERCVADPVSRFGDLLRFLGETPDDVALEEAIRRSRDTTRKVETGGATMDRGTVEDIVAGDRIYSGREGATELERFGGSGKSLLEIVSPTTARRLQSQLTALDPGLLRVLNETTIPTEGQHS